MPRRIVGILLLLLVFAFEMRAQGEVVLYIGGEPVNLSEFEYYYRKSPKQSPEAFLQSFINYKLKVRYAHDSGVDTLPAFRMQLAYYQGKLLKPYLVDSAKEEQTIRQIYNQSKQRLQMNDWIRIAHISKYLPQNASRRVEIAAQELMDSIYSALQGGADFLALARQYSDDEDSRGEGGLLPWMPVKQNMQEWVDRLATLQKDKISLPFYSPLGIHIVKWIDRKPCISYEEEREQILDYLERSGNQTLTDIPADKKKELQLQIQELQDGLLAAYLTGKYQSGNENSYRESDLERFFKQHKSDYVWDLPHYRGAVIQCKDKKTASAIKKYLKKKPASEWEEALNQLVGNTTSPKARIEAGIFQIGKNKYIDKLVFKCGDFEADATLPYTFVMGKKLKKGPEIYEDVKQEVLRDYLMANGDSWMKELKQKYKVEINQEVLKTVNNDGSN